MLRPIVKEEQWRDGERSRPQADGERGSGRGGWRRREKRRARGAFELCGGAAPRPRAGGCLSARPEPREARRFRARTGDGAAVERRRVRRGTERSAKVPYARKLRGLWIRKKKAPAPAEAVERRRVRRWGLKNRVVPGGRSAPVRRGRRRTLALGRVLGSALGGRGTVMPGVNTGRGGDGESGREQGSHGTEERSSVHTDSLVFAEKGKLLIRKVHHAGEYYQSRADCFPEAGATGYAGPVGAALHRACF